MSFSLHAATVPSDLQILGALSTLIDKAEAWCNEHGVAPSEIIDARLTPDMHPFGFQVKQAAVHSGGTIESLRTGLFEPDRSPWPDSFAGLRADVENAKAALEAVDPAEMESFIGREVLLDAGDRSMTFTAPNFLLSLSQPNFYFHVCMAYAILRMKGLDVGKFDYLGAMRIEVPA